MFPPPIVALADPSRLFGREGPGLPVGPALPVGMVRWPPEQERTTVVVKATYAYDPGLAEQTLQLAPVQPDFAVATASKRRGAADIELEALTDLVAAKPSADVLLKGHAYAGKAEKCIAASLRIPGKLRLALSTVGPSPIEKMPLEAEYLRDAEGEAPIPPVGPIQPRDVVLEEEELDPLTLGLTREQRLEQYSIAFDTIRMLRQQSYARKRAAAAALAEEEADDDEVDDDEDEVEAGEDASTVTQSQVLTWEDLTRFEPATDVGVQFAAAHSCCKFPRPGDELQLEGLMRGGDRHVLKLPGHLALVVYEGASQKVDVGMVIDSISIDTDAARVSIVWRGQIPEDVFATPSTRAIVALVDAERVPPLHDLFRSLPRARFSRAIVAEDAEVEPAQLPDVELSTARLETFGYVPDPWLTFEDYADVSAQLSHQPGRRAALLATQGFDEDDWMLEQKAWLGRVGAALAAGDMARVAAYNKVLADARAAVRTSAAAATEASE